MIFRATRRSGAALALVVTATLLLSDCGGKSKKTEAAPTSSTTPAPTPTPTPSAKPKPKPVAAVNPLTGIGAPPSGPIIGVKVDDTDNGRPPIGLDQADVIYIEQVEGGLTRMLAVFGTHKPVVEPVRSVRASDSELLRQYGKVVLVASGGGGLSIPTLDASGLVGVINDRGGPGFSRDYNRPAPYNLSIDLAAVSKAVKADGSRNVGFTWNRLDPRLAKAKAGLAVNATVGATSVTYKWDPKSFRYRRTIFGNPLRTAAGNPIATANVLVQFGQVIADPSDVDVVGNVSHYTKTVGSGRAVLFRSGKRIEGKWKRAKADQPTVFTDLAGKVLLFAPGGVNVVLASSDSSV